MMLSLNNTESKVLVLQSLSCFPIKIEERRLIYFVDKDGNIWGVRKGKKTDFCMVRVSIEDMYPIVPEDYRKTVARYNPQKEWEP